MYGLTIRVLYLGHIQTKRDAIIRTPDQQATFRSPMLSVLFTHPELGRVLYDTGNPEDGDARYSPAARALYPVKEVVPIKDALFSLGLSPADIDTLVLSHLHMDHAGGLPQFAGTKALKNGVIVNEDDAREAFFAVGTGIRADAYIRETLMDIPSLSWRPIRSSLKLCDELTLFTQRCHTPGVLGVLAKTKQSGNFLFVSDAIYTRDSFETNTPPGGTINLTDEEFYENLKYIRSLQKEHHAQLFFGHDERQYLDWVGKTIA